MSGAGYGHSHGYTKASLLTQLTGRIFRIFIPAGRVVGDVLANKVQGGVIADDMVVIVALPYRQTGRVP